MLHLAPYFTAASLPLGETIQFKSPHTIRPLHDRIPNKIRNSQLDTPLLTLKPNPLLPTAHTGLAPTLHIQSHLIPPPQIFLQQFRDNLRLHVNPIFRSTVEILYMSRVIIKNIPKVFSEREVVAHFSNIDEITDCRIARTENGESRRFAFLGFRKLTSAQLIRDKYDNTYLGSSKVRIEIAKLRGQPDETAEQERSRSRQQNGSKKQPPKEDKGKTFEKYKKVIQDQVKKSWDDLLVPDQSAHMELDEEVEGKNKRNKPEDKKKDGKEAIEEEKPKKEKEGKTKKQSSHVEPTIKAPKLSEKNKKFVTQPLEVDSNRLYITNIPYTLQQTDIRTAFSRFGNITKIKLPVEYNGSNKGYFFITFEKSQQALRAFSQMDNKVVFGRIIHIKPSLQDIGEKIKAGKEVQFQQMIKEKYGDAIEEKSSFKKRRKREMREKLNDTTNWNTLFLNPNTILERMAKKLHITKAEILLSDNLAPKVALAEAEVIQQTKAWMQQNGINLEFLQKDRQLCERSKKTLLIKNLNYRTQESDLRQLLSFYGIIEKLLLAPNRAIAIAELQTPEFAENVVKNLQSHKFKNNFIYLEYAPTGMIDEAGLAQQIAVIEQEAAEAEELSKVVYIKNLNFETQEDSLYPIFEAIGEVKYVKIVKGKEGRSMGFGFVEFKTNELALAAVKKLNAVLVDGHKLSLSLSRKKVQNVQDLQALKQKAQQQEAKNSKLLVKNLAFQASKQQIQELFQEYGSLKKVRLPKKMDGQHRGFAFVEYESVEEAALAKQALSSAHLYGRKLVIEYEKGSN